MKKFSLFITIAAFILLAGNALFNSPHLKASELLLPSASPEEQASTSSRLQTLHEFIAEEGDRTVLDVLQGRVDVAYEPTEGGVFLTGIGGLINDSQHEWTIYLNNHPVDAAIDTVNVRAGDTLSFRYQEVVFTE